MKKLTVALVTVLTLTYWCNSAHAKTCLEWLILFSQQAKGSVDEIKKDAIHDLFISWERNNRINNECTKSYVAKSIKNRCRTCSKVTHILLEDSKIAIASEADFLVDLKSRFTKIKTCLRPRQTEAITMYFYGYTHREIAEWLTIEETTVRKWFSRDIPKRLNQSGLQDIANKMSRIGTLKASIPGRLTAGAARVNAAGGAIDLTKGASKAEQAASSVRQTIPMTTTERQGLQGSRVLETSGENAAEHAQGFARSGESLTEHGKEFASAGKAIAEHERSFVNVGEKVIKDARGGVRFGEAAAEHGRGIVRAGETVAEHGHSLWRILAALAALVGAALKLRKTDD